VGDGGGGFLNQACLLPGPLGCWRQHMIAACSMESIDNEFVFLQYWILEELKENTES